MDKPRLIKALAVFALTLVLFGTVLGAAQAGAGDDPEPTVHLAFPRPGDRAEYDVEARRVGPGIPGVSLAVERMVAEWLPPSAVLGAEGTWHAVRSLRVGVSYTVDAPGAQGPRDVVRVAHYDLRTGEVVAMDLDSENANEAGVVRQDEDGGPRVGGDLFGTSGVFHMRDLRQPGHLCGFDAPMHDRPVPASEKVWLGPCSSRSGDLFVFDGTDEVDGVEAVRYRHRVDPDVRLWYNPGYPLPLRMQAALVEFLPSELRSGYLFDVRLAEAAVGDGDYGSTPLPERVPPAPLAPRTPLGPDTTGVAQPLPLADAVAAARADGQEPTLSGFLRTHPDAYLAAAFPHQYADELGRTAIDWFLLWTDGQDLLAKFVRQAPQRGELSALGLEGGLTVEDADAASVPDDPAGLYPRPDRLPDRLPTVAGALRLHAAHHPGQGAAAPLYWGFSYGCRDDCAEATFHLAAGVQQRPRDPEGTPLQSAEWVESVTLVGADGTVERTVDYDERPILPSVAPGDDPEPGSMSTAPTPSPWAVLTPAATTGAGLAALLAALAYYFWPHLKLVGLFSRIRRDRVLDHPQRARLDELVHEQPGIHFQELARTAGLGRGTTEHHLRKLAEAGRVVAHVGAGYTCYFPKGAVDRRVMAAAPVLKSGGARAVLAEVVAGRASSVRAVADAAGMGRSTVAHHLKRLREAGLVEDARPGYRAAGHARQALGMMAA